MGITNGRSYQYGGLQGHSFGGYETNYIITHTHLFAAAIEVGKIADLIILNKNPLDDIHNTREIRYVMKDGILYDGNTLDEIWPEKKKCPEWKLKVKDTTANDAQQAR